jgi:hypothetical protein
VAARLPIRSESDMSDKSVNSHFSLNSGSDALSRSNPAIETPEERQVSIAKLRDMSRDERLALLMRNFSVECAEVGGRPRRGAASPRKTPACVRQAAQESHPSVDAPDGGARANHPRRRPGL